MLLARRNQPFMQTLASIGGQGRISSEDVFTDRQCALVQDSCFWDSALYLLKVREIM